MKLLSLNIGKPRSIETGRGPVLTSIFKDPVEGRRRVVPHNIEGDRQADLSVHGGPAKAVYAYAAEHYPYWRNQLPQDAIAFGMFGENLTVDGLLESDIQIGDLFEIGSAQLRVTQPRMPCWKLALRFGRADMVKRFWKSNRSGVYFSVEKSGEIGAGDGLRLLESHPLRVSVADVISIYKGERTDQELFKRFAAAPIAGSWKRDVLERWNNS